MAGAKEQVRLMLVEDSAFMRKMLANIIENDRHIAIVATATNGAEAIEITHAAKPDVILLDVEMPVMDGLTALPSLLTLAPQAKVIMVSGLTAKGAHTTLKALELGAADYIAKPTAEAAEAETTRFSYELLRKIKALSPLALPPALPLPPCRYPARAPQALAIGASTGGPQALATLLKELASWGALAVPVFITQHMPSSFTSVFAQYLHNVSGLPCAEARDGEEAGHAVYIAPGDWHMTPRREDGKIIIRLSHAPHAHFCRPAVDPMLEALAAVYGDCLLAVILTGMGSDGLAGSLAVTAKGGAVIAQDENSSVVWGMPRAVAEHHICHAVLPLDAIAGYIARACYER